MNDKELESAMIFCILDTQMPYATVVRNYDMLMNRGIRCRESIRGTPHEDITIILKENGCRFPNQKSKYIKLFGDNPIDLKTATRSELVRDVKGVGMKLASLYLNWTRKADYAILDTHIISWLEERNLLGKDYLASESNFKLEADKAGLSTAELDDIIWNRRRRKW